jgi:CBS domain-containing protein
MASQAKKIEMRPNPCIVVRADATIGDCIRKMRDQEVGSVLILHEGGGPLVGIFTERDIVKQIDLIQHQEYWGKPVRMVMSRPVITLELKNLDRAADLMLKHRIRHLPVVTGSGASQTLVGVISIRDVLRTWVEKLSESPDRAPQSFKSSVQKQSEGKSPQASARELQLSVLGVTPEKGRAFVRLIQTALKGAGKVRSASYSSETIMSALQAGASPWASAGGWAILDLESLPASLWTTLIVGLTRDKKLKQLVILVDPSGKSPKVLQALERLAKSPAVLLARKPIQVLSFMDQIRLAFEHRG